jgi:hypothetical protein
LYIVKDFISEVEERELLTLLDSDEGCGNEWKLSTWNGPCDAKVWGVRTDHTRKAFEPPLHPMPALFRPLAARMRAVGGAAVARSFRPNEANALSYERSKGHCLAPHCDDRQLSGQVIANLCLVGDATMVYARDGGRPAGAQAGKRAGVAAQLDQRYEVHLPRRALQIQSGTVRYEYTHGIPTGNFHSERRVSITFRQNCHPYLNI